MSLFLVFEIFWITFSVIEIFTKNSSPLLPKNIIEESYEDVISPLTIEDIRIYYNIQLFKSSFSHIDFCPNCFHTLESKSYKKLEDLGYIKIYDSILPQYMHAKIIKDLPEICKVKFTKELLDFYNDLPKDWTILNGKKYELGMNLTKINAVVNSNRNWFYKPEFMHFPDIILKPDYL